MKQITNKEYEEWQKYKAEKAKATSFCRIQSGSSARQTDMTQKRSVSTSLKFSRRSVHLRRDNLCAEKMIGENNGTYIILTKVWRRIAPKGICQRKFILLKRRDFLGN